jgi:hypothetical protein
MDTGMIGFPNFINYDNHLGNQTDVGNTENPTSGSAVPKEVPASGNIENDMNHKVNNGYSSSPAECQTCKNRKYQDGSDENVSFKSAAHISPEAAGASVRGHEGEHVANAYTKAAEKGGKVLAATVTIHTSICPECGKSYVSGGTTSTIISYPKSEDSGRSSIKSGENFKV